MSALTRLGPYLARYRGQIAVTLMATVAMVAINALVPLQISRIIDEGVANDDTGVVATTVARLVGLVVAAMVLTAVSSILAVRVAFSIAADIRASTFRHIQSLSFANLDDLGVGELLVRLTSDTVRIQMFVALTLAFAAQAPLMMVASLVAMFTLKPSLAAILFVIIPASATVVWWTTARSERLYDAVQDRLDRLNTVLRENVKGALVVKCFVREDHQRRQFTAVNDDLTGNAVEVNKLVALLLPSLLLITNLAVAAVLWFGGNAVIDGGLTDGELVAFVNYLLMASMPVILLAMIQPLFSSAAASTARITEVLDARSPIRDDGTETVGPLPPSIEFENVSFSYNGGDPVLTEVSFRIEPGQTAAILGATGSGKTTLVHLIPRLYDPTGGRVMIGGVDARDLPLSDLRRTIGLAMQQPVFLQRSVADNVVFDDPDVDEADVDRALATAQASEFVAALADGADQMIEPGGANLSGGQRQRLSIARALAKQPAVLILDDATSALDAQTEARFRDALDANHPTAATTVLVAQKISSVLAADLILVIDHGRLVASGPHHELLQASDLYRSIYRSQLGEPEELTDA